MHYPSYRYHRVHAPRVVNDPAHELETAHPEEGWADSPAAFADDEPVTETHCSACGQALPPDDDSLNDELEDTSDASDVPADPAADGALDSAEAAKAKPARKPAVRKTAKKA